jgi:hypothetical protein
MDTISGRSRSVKWSYDVQRRGRVRKKFTIKVACHRPVELEDGGEDLVRCGTAMVTVIGFRPQFIGYVRKTITTGGGRSHTWEYHVTQPYTDKDKCRLACLSSIKAGESFEAQWDKADQATRDRWAAGAFRKVRKVRA